MCVPERGSGAQPSDGQHAPKRRHARWSHAPGLLPGTFLPPLRQTARSSIPSSPSAHSGLFPPSEKTKILLFCIHNIFLINKADQINSYRVDLNLIYIYISAPSLLPYSLVSLCHQVTDLRNKLNSSFFDTFPSTFLSHSGYLNAPKLHTLLHLRPVEPNTVTQPSRIHQLLHLHHLSVTHPGCAGRVSVCVCGGGVTV